TGLPPWDTCASNCAVKVCSGRTCTASVIESPNTDTRNVSGGLSSRRGRSRRPRSLISIQPSPSSVQCRRAPGMCFQPSTGSGSQTSGTSRPSARRPPSTTRMATKTLPPSARSFRSSSRCIGCPAAAATRGGRRGGAGPLEQRVNERRRRRARQQQQQAESQQDDQDRQQPPLLVVPEESPE